MGIFIHILTNHSIPGTHCSIETSRTVLARVSHSVPETQSVGKHSKAKFTGRNPKDAEGHTEVPPTLQSSQGKLHEDFRLSRGIKDIMEKRNTM